MVRVSRVLPHLTEAEVKEKICTANNFRRQQKWWIVYNVLVEPRTAEEIARHTGTSVRDVHQVISEYNRQGASALETPGAGGRRISYMTQEQEKAFLASLESKAKRGELTTKAEINKPLSSKLDTKFTKAQFIGCWSGTNGTRLSRGPDIRKLTRKSKMLS